MDHAFLARASAFTNGAVDLLGPLFGGRVTEAAAGRKLWTFYPDAGPLRRELYPKHLAFFRAGAGYRERLMLAANRVGKTEGVGGYELTLHLTGLYPPWWQGRRFVRPVRAWAAGRTTTTVRDILQAKLCGPVAHGGGRKSVAGTGLIPRERIAHVSWRPGIDDLADTLTVRHASGGLSALALKSYEQGRGAFEGTEQDVVWLDEEPPMAVYTECLIRTMTTDGLVMLTFTPLEGMSDVVMAFLDDKKSRSKMVMTATWDDAPHLSAAQKEELWQSLPPHQRDARAKGIPQLGSGAIYPVPESDILVEPFELPPYWPRAYGLDVGWNRTAAVWGAHDRESDTLYLYAEHYRGQAEPSVHAAAVRARGAWIPGAVDPAANGRSQTDGVQFLRNYLDLGLALTPARNGVESGLFRVWQRLSTGRLKVFRTLQHWLSEYRLYRRDEKGAVVKKDDHLMDATRYLVATGLELASVDPQALARMGRRPDRVIVDYDPLA